MPGSSCNLVVERERHREQCALSVALALRADCAADLVDDVFRDREPEAEAAELATDADRVLSEPLEDTTCCTRPTSPSPARAAGSRYTSNLIFFASAVGRTSSIAPEIATMRSIGSLSTVN